MVCVEEILNWVIVCWCSYDNKISVLVCFFTIKCSGKPEILFREIFFNVFVLYRRDTFVNLFHFLRYHVNSYYIMFL